MSEGILLESESFLCRMEAPLAILTTKRVSFDDLASLETKRELFGCLEALEGDPRVRALLFISGPGVLSGGFTRSWLDSTRAGSDDDAVPTDDERADRDLLVARRLNMLSQYILKATRFSKLLITAMQGEVSCPFAGLSLAADFRLVSQDMWFNLASVKEELIPGGGLAYFLPQYVGKGRATELLLTAGRITAGDALALGLVSEIIIGDDFEASCIARATALSERPAHVIAGIRSLLAYDAPSLEAYLAEEAKAQIRAMNE